MKRRSDALRKLGACWGESGDPEAEARLRGGCQLASGQDPRGWGGALRKPLAVIH